MVQHFNVFIKYFKWNDTKERSNFSDLLYFSLETKPSLQLHNQIKEPKKNKFKIMSHGRGF